MKIEEFEDFDQLQKVGEKYQITGDFICIAVRKPISVPAHAKKILITRTCIVYDTSLTWSRFWPGAELIFIKGETVEEVREWWKTTGFICEFIVNGPISIEVEKPR